MATFHSVHAEAYYLKGELFAPESMLNGGVGDQGERGEKGDQGEKGEQGLRGPQGIEGLRGPQGIQGDVGPEGPPGATTTVSVDGTETIVTGPEGPQGIQGIQGIQGDRGERGPDGPRGETGPRAPEETRVNVGFTVSKESQAQRDHRGRKVMLAKSQWSTSTGQRLLSPDPLARTGKTVK